MSGTSSALPRVLVIDDEPGILSIVQVNLEASGFQVDVAETGEAGLAQARQHPPDLMILDVLLPGMDGWEVLEQVEQDPELAGLPVIMLTARASDTDILRGLEQGAVEYLTKPFYPADLVAAVKINLRVFDSALREQHRRELIARRRRLMAARALRQATWS